LTDFLKILKYQI